MSRHKEQLSPGGADQGGLAHVVDMLAGFGRKACLTPALQQRLVELGTGLSNPEIAIDHGISVNTVKTQVRSLLRILELDCRHELAHAVRSAQARLREGMPTEQVEELLRLQLEPV